MMGATKFRIGARVPNEGARRLAQWLIRQPVGTYDALARKLDTGIIAIDRMLAGEIVPDDTVGYRIYAFTQCAVQVADWDRPAKGGWFEPTLGRPNAARAA